MALKLIFKFIREGNSPRRLNGDNIQWKTKLQSVFDQESIVASHVYQPARDSIKAIFSNEAEIDKVMKKEAKFKENNFEPKMSLSLKACRTIFCTNLDPALQTAYSTEDLKDLLNQQEWKVKDIYKMRSGKSMKI